MDELLELTRRAEAAHFWFRGFRRLVAPALARVAAGRCDLRLLDCGSGTGQNLEMLRPYGRTVGFDLSTPGLARARSSGHQVVRADIARIPLASGTFDVATSFDVLQCVAADTDAVGEMARVVKPGGAVVLTLAALDVLYGDHSEAWGEYRRYTPASARRLVEAAGLRVERIDYLFASLFPLMLGVRTMQRLLRPYRQLRLDTDIAVPPAPINGLLTAAVFVEAAVAPYVRMPIGTSLLVVGRKPPASAQRG